MIPTLRLAPRLALLFVGFGAAVLAGIGGLAYRSGRESLHAATVSELLSTAIEKQAAINAWIKERQTDVAVIAQEVAEELEPLVARSPGASGTRGAQERLGAELRRWTGEGAKYLDLLVIEPKGGQVVAATDPSEVGKFKEDRAYFREGRLRPYAQSISYSVTLQAPGMTVAAPIRSPDGRLLGVLAGRLDLAQLGAIVTRRTGLRATDDAYLVTPSRLFATQPRLLGDAGVLRRGVHTEAVRRCLDGDSGVLTGPDYRGIPALVAYRWLPERQLCLVVKVDKAEALAPTRAFGQALLAAGAVILGLASVMAVGLARGITHPMRALQAGAARLGRGELAVRLPETRRDELGDLAREFNAMAGALAAKDAELRAHAEALDQRVRERTEALRELEAANRELEAFSYSVSHDLRAPLRAIDGFSRMLLESHAAALPPEGQRHLRVVRDNVRQMGQLVDDLLAFSRLGRQALKVSPTEPAALVREALEELRSEREERRVEIVTGDLPACEADRALLRQVFLNLLSNALKFTRRRDPARIEVGCLRQDGQPVYFVRDNGAGFDMRYAGKLFGVFQRLHRPDEYEGTGVGLAIVHRIVHRHGGRIWAESAPDQGATFSFTLPGGPDHA